MTAARALRRLALAAAILAGLAACSLDNRAADGGCGGLAFSLTAPLCRSASLGWQN
jgi:hypothetical protein